MKGLTKILFCLLIIATGCSKDSPFESLKPLGKTTTEVRSITSFNAIQANNDVNVIITQDSSFEVKVEAPENMQDKITAEIDGTTLVLRNKNKFKWAHNYEKQTVKIYVKVPYLKDIANLGIGKITATNTISGTGIVDVTVRSAGDLELTMIYDEIFVHMNGSGDITLSGNTQNFQANNQDNGFLNCGNLISSYGFLYTRTTGNCFMNITNLFDLNIVGRGDVYLKGSPTINSTITGSGKLIRQ